MCIQAENTFFIQLLNFIRVIMESWHLQALSLFLLASAYQSNGEETALSCPGGGTIRKDTLDCYKILEEIFTWKIAEKECNKWGGHMASIHSNDEDEFVKQLLIQMGRKHQIQELEKHSPMWLGGIQTGEDDVEWSDGTNPDYKNFYVGNIRKSRNESCIAAWYRKQNGTWVTGDW